MNFRSRKWTVPLLLILIFLAIGVFLTASLGKDFFKGDLKGRLLGSFSQNPFRKQSQVKVSLIDSKLNLSFDLIEEDKPKFRLFVDNWFSPELSGKYGVEADEDIQTLSVGIDEGTKAMLAQNLPVDLTLAVTEKSLGFGSNKVVGLQNPLVKNDIKFATGSSKLDVEYSDSSKYQLKIENPADLLNYATASGVLTASPKLEGLFKTLPKVATIELNVNGKSISGQIVLK